MKDLIFYLRSMLIRFGKFLNTKPIQSCVKESSKKSVFQSLLLVQDYFYGLIQAKPILLAIASPEAKIGQNVNIKKSGISVLKSTSWTKPQNNASNKPKAKKSIYNFLKLNFHAFKVKSSNSLYVLWENRRLRAGIIILLILAPVSKFFYKLFPQKGFGEFFVNNNLITIKNTIEGADWYYEEIYWWAFSCGEIWSPLLAIVGIFFLFPKNYYPGYLTGVPFGYYLSLLLQRIFATSESAFHNGMGPSTLVMFLIFGVIAFAISDKILFKDNHGRRAIEARII